MKGLMLKDLYAIKDGLLVAVLIMAALGTGLSVVSSPWILIVVAASSLSMSVAMTIPADKISQWYKFSATLPVTRAQIITSKYFMYAIFSFLGILLGSVIAIVVTLTKGSFELDSLLLNVCLAVVMSLLPGVVNIPCSFLFDAEKSINGLILSYIVTAGLFMGVRFVLGRFMDLEANLLITYIIIAALSLVIYLISWIFSPKALSSIEI